MAAATEAERAARVGTYENPRPEVQALVPRDAQRVLDLGCASGALGAALKAARGAPSWAWRWTRPTRRRRASGVLTAGGAAVVPLPIGAGTVFTYNTLIRATVEVSIGERCLFANGASVVDSKHAFRRRPRAPRVRPVRVGDRAVIGANSVVTRPIEPLTVAAGAPARELERLG
jgi:hypothetical protein